MAKLHFQKFLNVMRTVTSYVNDGASQTLIYNYIKFYYLNNLTVYKFGYILYPHIHLKLHFECNAPPPLI